MANTFKFIGLIAAVFLTALLIVSQSQFALGSAPSGLYSTVASSSQVTASAATARLLIATSSQCASRVISTRSSAVVLTFSDKYGEVPGPVVGHVLAASSSFAYDSGLYGCGAVRVYSFGTQVIDVTETQ